MKNTIILFFCVLTCFGCVKKENQDSKNMDNSVIVGNVDDKPVADKVPTLQEQIKNYDDKYILLFQEEGNFTNSGNTETLAFYQSKSTYLNKEMVKVISKVYCFIYNENKIIKVFEINYSTMEFEHLYEIPMDVLGREIRWNGNRYGYIGDFNENGKEEIYLYRASGIGDVPKFYEFQKDSFKQILDTGISIYINLVYIDTEKKILTFKDISGIEPEIISFIWNKDDQIYEKIDKAGDTPE